MRCIEGESQGQGSRKGKQYDNEKGGSKINLKMHTERMSFCRLQLIGQQLQRLRGTARLRGELDAELRVVYTRRALNTTPRLKTGSTFALIRGIT